MKFFTVLAFLFLAAIVNAEEKKDYTNYKFIQVFPNTEAEALMLASWEINNNDFDVWSSVKKDTLMFDVMLSPEAFVKYTTMFNQLNIPFIVLHQNVQQFINKEAKELENLNKMGESKVVGKYARLADIFAWLDTVEQANPSFVSQQVIGQSNQGRDLRVLKIKVGSPSKRIWFDCAIHAREWISPATCVNLIDKFVNDYNNNIAGTVNILNNYELHFLTVHNPDGYEYSHVSDRFWRKNRKVNSGSTCAGVDLNRNFPYAWLTGGSSLDPCSDTHAGPSAASEPEAKAVINYITNNGPWTSFLTIHSYGNWFLTSFGNTAQLPADYVTQKAAGDIFAAAVKSLFGQIFVVGSTANLLYIASGGSSDWAYGDQKIVHSYTIELRPRNGSGILGFDLPTSQIADVGKEIYAGILALINSI